MSDRSLRVQLIFDALDRLTGPLRNIGVGSEQARQALAETQSEIRRLSEAQKDLARFKDAESAFAATAEQLAAAQSATQALREEMEATGEPTQRMTRAFAEAERREARLRAEHERHEQRLRDLARAMDAAGVDVTDLAEHEERLRRETEDANRELTEQTRRLERMRAAARRAQALRDTGGRMMAGGGAAIGAGVAVGAALSVPYEEAKNFESAVADIKKVLNFTPEGLKQINSDLMDMSTRVPMAAEGLAQIAAAAGRAGVAQEALKRGDIAGARQELMQFTEDAAKMGVAFDISAEEAGETMAKWRTAFGLPQRDVARLGDQVNALTNQFGGNASEVTEMVTRIGPLGKVAGVAAPHMAAMAQVMNSVGTESEVGATGIKNLMLTLTKGAAATKGQSKAFAQLGLDAEKVSKAMQTDSGGTIIDVLTRLQKLPKDMQAGVLTELFGSESVAAIAPMLTSLDQLKENMRLVGTESRYAGSMTNEFLSRIATTEGATGLAGNSLKALNIELGTHLLPTVQAIAGAVTPLANGFRQWANDNPALAGSLMTFLGIAAGLVTLLGVLGVAAGAATFAFGALGIATWAALWPILAVIAAIALIGAAIYFVVKHFDTIKKVAGDVFQSIKDWCGNALKFLTWAFMNFTPVGLLIQAFGKVFEFFRTLDMKKIGGDIINGIVNGILMGIPGLIGAFIKMAAAGVTAFKEKLGIKSPSRVMMGMGGFINDGLAAGLRASQDGPIGRMRQIADGIAGQVQAGGSMTARYAVGGRPAGGASAAGGSFTFNVYGAPGQSPQEIAQEVWRLFSDQADSQNARQRSAYRDDED